MRPIRWLIRLRPYPIVGPIARWALFYGLGMDIPRETTFGTDIVLHHGALGLVTHPLTSIGNRVHIYHRVTLGRADAHTPIDQSSFQQLVVEDDVWLGVGAVVLGGPGVTTVRRGTVIGANSTLLQSTDEWEIWVGSPARCVGRRRPPD